MSEWSQANPEKHRQNVAAWRERNRERAREAARAWYQANKERAKATAAARRAADPDKWRLGAQARTRKYRQGHPDINRAALLRQKYRLTPEEFAEMLAQQGGVCAICSQPETAVHRVSGTLRQLGVDHDHGTGAIRGLLCSACNVGIGRLGDDPDRIESAARYLRSHMP